MKLIIKGNTLSIEDVKVCYSGTINCYKSDVEFDESWRGLTIEAVILPENETVGERLAVINNQICLSRKLSGVYYIGFVGYSIENEEKVYQTSTELKQLVFYKGAGEYEVKEGEELPPPTQWEKYITEIQKVINEANNLNLELVDNELIITHKDGSKTTTKLSESGDTNDYNDLNNQPSINNVVLEGNKTLDELGIQAKGNYVKDTEIDELENVLRDILNSIQSGVSSSIIIEEIEQIIVSYFENKTVEEVEA